MKSNRPFFKFSEVFNAFIIGVGFVIAALSLVQAAYLGRWISSGDRSEVALVALGIGAIVFCRLVYYLLC